VLGQSVAVPAGFSADVVNGSVYQFAPTVAGATGFFYDFGDLVSGNANTSTAAAPVHGFSQPGQYTVTQVVTGSSGCVNTDVQMVSADAAVVSGRVWKGSGGAKAGAARVWLLRQQSPNGPFVAVDSQTVTLPDTLFAFPIPFGYTEPFLLYAALLPQDTGYTHWQPTYYGDTPLKAQATRAQAATLTSLADIHLGKSTGTDAGAPALVWATVSPNPFANSLFITWQEGPQPWTATLYASDGRQVLAHACAGEHATLNVAHLPAGVYLLRVSGGGKEAAFRVVKE
jgi:PKD repeat protein